jgi:hypothetical protein
MEETIEKNRSIELDCAPGATRPGDLFPGVLAETNLTEEDFEITSKLFGNWEWVLTNKDKAKDFDEANPVFKTRIDALYKSGKIRYGSW